MTRARPSTVPAETGRPVSAPTGTIGAPVRTCDGLAVRREDPRRRERLIGPERVLALADELIVYLVRARDVVELVEPEVEDVFPFAKHMIPHEALGLVQQGLLVDEVAADHVVLRILPVPGKGADPVDQPLGLLGLLLSVQALPVRPLFLW